LLAAAGFGACVGLALGQSPPPTAPAAVAAGQPLFSLRLMTGRVLPLSDGAVLQSADVPGCRPRLLRSAVARVVRRPDIPSVVGLQNLSRGEWVALLGNGSQVRVGPGSSVGLVRGTRIHFGSGPDAVAEVL
jgi:hypothetical protein